MKLTKVFVISHPIYTINSVLTATMAEQGGNQYLFPEKRALIVGYRLAGHTVKDTALRFNVSISTVSKLVAKFRHHIHCTVLFNLWLL